MPPLLYSKRQKTHRYAEAEEDGHDSQIPIYPPAFHVSNILPPPTSSPYSPANLLAPDFNRAALPVPPSLVTVVAKKFHSWTRGVLGLRAQR